MSRYLCVLAALLAVGWASDVLELTGANFESEVSKSDLMLVEFYAPWCGHCKKLAPEYEKAATSLLENDPPVPIAKVDCVAEESKELCSKFDVTGFPTMKVFKGGETTNPEDYNGPREAAGIAKYMKAQAGPSSKELTTAEEFDKVLSSNDHIIIGYFADMSSALAKNFLRAADSQRDIFKFAHSSSAEVCKDKKDVIELHQPKRLHSKLEDSFQVYSDASATKDSIVSFVKDNFAGLTGHMTEDNAKLFKKPGCVVYYQVDYVKNAKGTNYWRNRVMKVAQKFVGKMTFAVAAKEDFHALSEMGIDIHSEDLNVVVYNENGQKFRLDPNTKFSMEELEKFVQQFLDGQLEPYLKSEDVPADNSGPVKVVVAKNFDAIVNDPERDVLIEFYAPWCGHCKSLEPKFKELGEKLHHEDSVVIAKMDATANDVPKPFEVRGFPTLFWVPKGNKSSPKKYEGGREVDDFLAYIKKESSNKDLKTKDEL